MKWRKKLNWFGQKNKNKNKNKEKKEYVEG